MTKCDICGKEFDVWDQQEGFGFDRHIGYGSKFDGEHIRVDMCVECFDEMMEKYILPKCNNSNISKEYLA